MCTLKVPLTPLRAADQQWGRIRLYGIPWRAPKTIICFCGGQRPLYLGIGRLQAADDTT
jgi:hypothetical protein